MKRTQEGLGDKVQASDKKRNKEKAVLVYSTVKMTLCSFCKEQALMDEIEICVRGITRTAIEVSRFFNYYVLKMLETEQEIPEIKQGLINAAFTELACSPRKKKKSKFGTIMKDYKSMRPEGFACFQYKKVPQLLNYAALDYLTACKNHVSLNFFSRVAKAFYRFLDTLPEKFKAKDKAKMRRHFIGRLKGAKEAKEEEEAMWSSLEPSPKSEFKEKFRQHMQETLDRYKSVLPVSEYSLKKDWWKYLGWLRDLMPNTTDVPGREELPEGEEPTSSGSPNGRKNMKTREARQYSILPLNSFAMKHITIDTIILRGLLQRMAMRSGGRISENRDTFKKRARFHWEQYFHLSKAMKTWDFHNMIKTDGYAVSVIREKMKKGSTVAQELPTPEHLVGKRIIGVDPGRVSLVTCGWNVDDTETKQAFSHYSNGEYQNKIGLADALQKRRKWQEKANLADQLLNLPTAKTPDSVVLELHIQCLLQMFDKVLELNGKRRVRSLRFTQYGRRQRVMHDICERIVKKPTETDDRPVIVAFGDAGFSSSSLGHAPGPVKAVRKALRQKKVELYDVNEYNTSKLCHGCHKVLEPMYSEGGAKKGEPIHGVRRCTTSEHCKRKTLNRDINAALNILHVFVEEVCTGERPKPFTPNFQQPTFEHADSSLSWGKKSV